MNARNRLAFCLMPILGVLCAVKPATAELGQRSQLTPPARAERGPQLRPWDELNLKPGSDKFGFSQWHSSGQQGAIAQSTRAAAALAFSYPTFDSQLLDKQLELYLRYLAVSGPPDVLIVGSSRSLQGVDPIALQAALASQGYPKLKIFNFGINGATARVVDLLLRKILTPDQLPKLLVWADGVRAFNSGRVDRTYRAIVASPGYQRLSAGIRPSLNPLNQSPTPTPPAASPAPMPPAASPTPTPPAASPTPTPPAPSPTPTPPSNDTPRRPIYRAPVGTELDPINFLPQKPTIPGETPDILLASYKVQKLAQSGARYYQRQSPVPSANPEAPRANPATATTGTSDSEMAGFVAVGARYDPATYYQRYRRVPGQFDGDYASFSLQGEQREALLSVVAFAKERQLPLVIVNLPLTYDYLDPVRSQYEREFQQSMQRLARERGFMFRDLSNQWPARHDYFADPSHLNRYGAEAVSRQLAQDRTIPWPTPRRSP